MAHVSFLKTFRTQENDHRVGLLTQCTHWATCLDQNYKDYLIPVQVILRGAKMILWVPHINVNLDLISNRNIRFLPAPSVWLLE